MSQTKPTCFDFAPRTRVVFGPGALVRLGELVAEQGGRRVLLVTDPGILAAGHVRRALDSLAAAGVHVSVFDGVVENPTTAVVDACVAQARRDEIDLLVGLGGGSSLDTAKGCNFVLTGGGRMEDYWGVGKATRPMLPLVAVPTTAGTGSECQSFALISQQDTHVKMACGDPKAAARVAILDPELTLTQPHAVAAATGIDALAHAVESAVTTRRNAVSAMFSREAFRLGWQGFRGVLADPTDLEARGWMQLAAALAGAAIENSMLGAAHAAANPLTAHYDVIHGRAVGLMLPAVVRFNATDPASAAIYRELASLAGLDVAGGDAISAAFALAEALEGYLAMADLPRSLAEIGVGQELLPRLAEEAAGQWTAGFNPRGLAANDFLQLYRSLSGGCPQHAVTGSQP